MKRVLIAITISIIMMAVLFTNSYAALSAKVSVVPDKTTANPGDVITLTLKVSDVVDAGTGISALEGYLEYDQNIFEQPKVIGGTINPTTNQFVANTLVTEADGEVQVLTIKLTVKSGATGTTTINVKDIVLSTGETDTTSENISLNITIGSQTPDDGTGDGDQTPDDGTGDGDQTPDDGTGDGDQTPDDGTGDGDQTPDDGTGDEDQTPGDGEEDKDQTPNNGTDEDKKDDTQSKVDLPAAGVKYAVIGIILALVVIAGITYKYSKKYEKI